MKTFNSLFFVVMLVFSGLMSFGQKKSVAIATFYVDRYIDFSQLGSNAAFGANMLTLAEDSNFNLKPVLAKFHDMIFDDFSKDFPFDLYPEEKVIGNQQYIDFKGKYGNADKEMDDANFWKRFIPYPGYKPLVEYLAKKGNSDYMLDIFGNETDGIMFIYIDFEFVPKMAVAGMGTCGVKAFAKLKCWNKLGKKVFAINESAISSKSIPMVMGFPILKLEEILPMCENATDKLLIDLKARLPKIVKKSASKL